MSESGSIRRALFRGAAMGAPWGAAGVYLVFVLGNAVSIPPPSGGALLVVSGNMAAAYGNPVTAALVQLFWSGLLGAVLGTAGVPFLLERRTLPWSGAHFLVTAAVFSLAGWRCRWFPLRESWLCLLGLLMLCYVLAWAVRYIGWRQDLLALRRAAGLPADGGRRALPYPLLAAAVELALPWLLAAVDARDFPILTGIFYPFLVLPLFCFLSAASLGRRRPWLWTLGYAALCALLTLPDVFLLYNDTALFQARTAGIAALAGGALGTVLEKRKKEK